MIRRAFCLEELHGHCGGNAVTTGDPNFVHDELVQLLSKSPVLTLSQVLLLNTF